LKLLDAELRHLKSRACVVQLYVTEEQVGLDGGLRGRVFPRKPGVIVSFESKHGPLSYPCDRFDVWRDNVRAVALSLEALRKIDRYGVTQTDEQYRGWQRLGMTPAWAELLARESGMQAADLLRSIDLRERAIRQALINTHPDHGGSADRFTAVHAAISKARAS